MTAIDTRRAFRVRDGRLLVILGVALASAALLLTALAARDIARHERLGGTLQAALDSVRALRATGGPTADTLALDAEIAERAYAVGSAYLHAESARQRRAGLWGWKGVATLLAALGGLFVGAGVATLRRARVHAAQPPE